MSMQAGFPAAYDCSKAFSESDFTDDLKKFDIPTLIIHGEDDQIVPIRVGGERAAKLFPGATFKVYKDAPHGLMTTHQEQFNEDLKRFSQPQAERSLAVQTSAVHERNQTREGPRPNP
jgi:non-heme chloroperoxidase